MALIVFLRVINVGGHRTFRPSILARELSDYDVVNVGAAGTFVVRKPGAVQHWEAAIRGGSSAPRGLRSYPPARSRPKFRRWRIRLGPSRHARISFDS